MSMYVSIIMAMISEGILRRVESEGILRRVESG